MLPQGQGNWLRQNFSANLINNRTYQEENKIQVSVEGIDIWSGMMGENRIEKMI